MDITREKIDDLNAVLKVKIVKTDYADKVENVLKDYRKKANIKGFRPGMVPIGVIRKMYGNAVKIDEINKVVSDNIRKYLTDEKIEILGDPLPKADDHEPISFETQDDFSFTFELGLAPAVEIGISKKNIVNSYEIAVDEKMKTDYADNYARRFGEFRKSDVSEDKDILKGRINALDNEGNIKPDGPSSEESTLAVDIIKDDEIKKSFIGKNANDSIDFDIKKAFPNENEVAGLLKMKKEEVVNIEGNFRFTVSEITRFHPAEISQDLFNRIYGEGIVNSEEEFMKKIEEEITASLRRESDYKLMQDVRKLAIEKTDLTLPEDFLKRWLLKVNEKTTSEEIEKEFDSFRQDLKWQLIRNRVAKDNQVKITDEEMQKEAENITRLQFRQYGLFYATDEQISNYAKETLKREDDAKRIADRILEDKVIVLLKEMAKIEDKSVTAEEFNKLFE
ncbi:MAG: trigger factor [Bacteroidetes bacterium RBG_13_43_22]|nr:MAG: trigger factor [Bacteroidetes bacterium RBG_13_43_22]